MSRRFLWLSVYAVAMAYLESAVVVYLRALYYPGGFGFPLAPMPAAMALIEVGREAATIVMLVGVAMLAGTRRWERFLNFAFLFGVWDIFYYVWLHVLIGWPPSLATPDILFLIPLPWVSPVLAPVLVSLALIAGSVLLARLERRGAVLAFTPGSWTVAILGGAIVLFSFMVDSGGILRGGEAPPFRWGLFLAGLSLGIAALGSGLWRLRGMIGAATRP